MTGGALLSQLNKPADQSKCEPATGAIAPDGNTRGRNAKLAKKSPSLQHIIEGCWEGMFRSEAIADGERPHPGRAARLRYQPAVTKDGTGAIAPAVKIPAGTVIGSTMP